MGQKSVSFKLASASEAEAALCAGIALGNAELVERALKSGASPHDAFSGEVTLELRLDADPAAGGAPASVKTDSKSFYLSALGVCGALVSSPEVFDLVLAASRRLEAGSSREQARYRSRWGSVGLRSAIEEGIAHAARQKKKEEDSWSSRLGLVFVVLDPWRDVELSERLAFIARAISKTQSAQEIPWGKLAAWPEGAELLAQAIDLWAGEATVASEILAECAGQGARAGARRVLEKMAGALDTTAAITQAASARHEELARELARPTAVWAIKAGDRARVEELLSAPDASWVSAPGALTDETPLSAALKGGELEWARRLIEKGADPKQLARCDQLAEPAPLAVERALAGDAKGASLLLDAGSPVADFERMIKAPSGESRSALGWLSLKKEESAAEIIADALARGASPLSITQVERPLAPIQLSPPSAGLWLKAKRLGAASKEALLSGKAGGTLAQFAAQVAKSSARVKAFLYPAPKLAAPSAPLAIAADAGLSLTLAQTQFARCAAPPELHEKAMRAMKLARALQAGGELPATDFDQMDLKRLWERNLPLFFERLSGLPPEERAWKSADGSPGPWAKLDAALDTAIDTMGLMRSKAVTMAHDRLDTEAAVLASSAGRSLERFKELMESASARSDAQAQASAKQTQGPGV